MTRPDPQLARREVLGDEHVDRAGREASAFTRPILDFIAQVAWGDLWSRPDLDRRTRSCVTVAILAALGRERELELHAGAALRNGVSEAELREVILHAGVYGGVPMARAASIVVDRVLAEGR